MNLFEQLKVKLGLGMPVRGEGKLPFTLKTSGAGIIVDLRIEGPKETFEIQGPNRSNYKIISEKTPVGIKGMANGTPAQLSVTIEDLSLQPGNKLCLKHVCYIFMCKPEPLEMQVSLADFACAVNDLKNPVTFIKGISTLSNMLEREHMLFCIGEKTVLRNALNDSANSSN